MSYVVCEPCVGCKYSDCVAVCPVDAFREGKEMLFIHPDECIECSLCQPECPVDAIFPEQDVPSVWESYIARNAEEAPGSPIITEQ